VHLQTYGGFSDWVRAETGNQVLKAHHPEFEMRSQELSQ